LNLGHIFKSFLEPVVGLTPYFLFFFGHLFLCAFCFYLLNTIGDFLLCLSSFFFHFCCKSSKFLLSISFLRNHIILWIFTRLYNLIIFIIADSIFNIVICSCVWIFGCICIDISFYHFLYKCLLFLNLFLFFCSTFHSFLLFNFFLDLFEFVAKFKFLFLISLISFNLTVI
jgi:hypothetical protein